MRQEKEQSKAALRRFVIFGRICGLYREAIPASQIARLAE
jgi:hypothetical protein